MSALHGSLHGWPALAGWNGVLPALLSYERGVWGKLHGDASGFRWIATTPAFAAAGRREELATELNLGSEDAPRRASHWRTVGDLHYAVSSYPSRASDAAGRTSFLEKQVLEWRRPPDLPAVVGALALLPLAVGWDDGVWWGRQSGPRWSEDEDATLSLSPAEHSAPLPVDAAALEAAVGRGIDALSGAVTDEALAELYVSLLAGQRAVRLGGLAEPLPAEAVAALLLPLPRQLADTLSIAGWLPSLRLPDRGQLERCWELALGGEAGAGEALSTAPAAAPGELPTASHRQAGQAMAKALRSRTPPGLAGGARPGHRPAAGAPHTVELAMWGPPSAGKTALLAKLYIDAQGDWEVFPTETSLQFINDMRTAMRANNAFPKATVAGNKGDAIDYTFRNRRTGMEVSLHMQDRPGEDSVKLTEGIRASLANAAGLVLLLDPLAESATLESQVWSTFQLMHVAGRRGARRDDRPIAVCVSKADTLIATPADLRFAREQPHQFVLRQDQAGLTAAVERFWSNYRFFPVSAAGVLLQHGVVEPAVFYDEALKPRLRPGGELNLMAPFAWLLEQVTGEYGAVV